MNSRTNRKADAQIFRDAAKLIELDGYPHGVQHGGSGWWGCDALWYAAGAPDGRVAEYYVLKDRFAKYFDNGDLGWFGERDEGENRDQRILALCFMAAIVERA